MEDSKTFLYKNNIYEQFENNTTFFNLFQYDSNENAFFIAKQINIDHEDWHKLTLMPNDITLLINYYIEVKTR